MCCKTIRGTAGLAAVAVAFLCLSGCGGFSPDDFKKVTKGMTKADAVKILGTPIDTISAGEAEWAFFKSGDKYYNVSFESGKVGETMGPFTKEEHDKAKATLKETMDNLKKMLDKLKK